MDGGLDAWFDHERAGCSSRTCAWASFCTNSWENGWRQGASIPLACQDWPTPRQPIDCGSVLKVLQIP